MAAKTKIVQNNIQTSRAVKTSALGKLVVPFLKILTITKNINTNRVIRPDTLSGEIRKEIHDMITNKPDTRNKVLAISSYSFKIEAF